jgi:uncharacterized protein
MGLRRTFHEGIASVTTRHPRLVVAVALLVTVLAGSVALEPLQNIDTDILRQLPGEMPEVQAYRRAVRDFGALDHLYGVVETSSGTADIPLLIDAAQRLAVALDNPEFVFEVQWSLDPDTQDHYGEATGITHGLLLPAEQWASVRDTLFNEEALHERAVHLRHLLAGPMSPRVVREQMRDPLQLGSTLLRQLLLTRSPVSFDPRSGRFISQDGSTLLMVIRPLKPPTDLLFSQALMHHVRQAAVTVEVALGEHVRIGYLGPHTETLYDTSLLRKDVVSTALASGLCVVILFIIAFRRLSAILFVGLPLVVGIIWTLGLIALFIGHLTIVTCAFAAIVLGLGIDFGIHLYNRFLEDRLEGNRSRQSVRTALVEVGPGVFTSAVTTALGFFALLLTDFPGFRELGIIGGSGVLCCLLSMYFLMPSLLMVLHHRQPRSRYQRLTSFGLEGLADAVVRRPRTTLLGGLIVTAWLGFLSIGIQFDDNLFHLREIPPEQISLRNRVANRFGLPSQPLLLTVSRGPNLQAALSANDVVSRRLVEISEDHGIAAIDSLRTLLPSVEGQNQTQGVIESFDVDAVGEAFRAEAAAVGLSPAAVQVSLDRLRAWQRQTQDADPLRLSLASRQSLRRLVTNYVTRSGENYRVMTSVYPHGSPWSGEAQELLISDLTQTLTEEVGTASGGEVTLEVTGVTALVDNLRRLIKRDLVLTVFVVTLGVLAVLWFHFRSIRTALLVTVPVLTAVLWTLGLMALAGASLNFINVLALPIIIGLGIDNGLHIIERHRGTAHGCIDIALVKTGRAVVITSLSTILGFGALSLASFRGIQALGLLALVGVAVTLISAITLIPALVETIGSKKGWRGLLRPDAG